jgi:hypothetical protein
VLVEGRPFAPAFAVCVRSDPRPRLESAAPTGEDGLAVGVPGGRVSGAAAEEARVLHGDSVAIPCGFASFREIVRVVSICRMLRLTFATG